jgi:hypothetical protein
VSQGYEIELLLEVSALLFHLGRKLGRHSEQGYERHLLRQTTQITDGQLLRQALQQLEVTYREDGAEHLWGSPMELEVLDEVGRPWFALAWDDELQAYAIYRPDLAQSQESVPPEAQLSTQDPGALLGRLAQQYGYLKTLRALLQQGYQTQGPARRQADGSQVLLLQRQDPQSDELQTVRLIFKESGGQATLLTDSRQPDGKHGVCPPVEPVLQSIGIKRYDKWSTPAADAAEARARQGQSPRQSKGPKEEVRRRREERA